MAANQRKVERLKLDGDSLTISYDNGDFTCATVLVEEVAKLLENNMDKIVEPDEPIKEKA